MKYYVYNPFSNNKLDMKLFSNLNQSCLFDSTNKQRMNELKSILKKNDIIYIIGGDGTINYLLNNYFYIFEYQINYYKSGSGNDFYRSLNNNTNYIYQINNSHYFINSFGIGFDALVCQNTNVLKKKTKLSYFIQAYKSINNYQPKTINIIYNNQKYTYNNVWLCSLQNGKYFGGGIKIAKNADTNDEKIDLCIGYNLNKLSVLVLLLFVKLGFSHLFKKHYFTTKVTNILIENDKEQMAQFDGDVINLKENITITKIKKINIKKVTSLD